MSHTEFQTLNPTTGKVVKTFPQTTNEEVSVALDKAQDAFQHWRRRAIADRASVMAQVATLMRERVEELAQLATLEMGKPIDQSRSEVNLSAKIIEYYVKNAEEFLKPKSLTDSPGSVVATEPIGVILAIEPWNFPFYQVARVVGPQIVAGNVVIVKHAPTVPQCALALARLFKDAGTPDGVYTNIFSSIRQVNALIDDFRVRGVTLTGSEVAGAAVAERAGRQLKKVVLELGGSDPFIVLEDAPLQEAIGKATIGRMMTTGQACGASKRIIVIGKERGKQFLEGLKQAMSGFKPGDPADQSTRLGPVFSERGLTKLLEQIEKATASGAKLIIGGKRINRPGFYIEPTIITDISPENPMFHEETFGPVASFYVVETEEEAIELANATKFGLGASIFGADIKHAQEVAAKIDSGMVFVNSVVYSGPEVPFGGIKNSGFGRELSELGIGEFVNKKLIRIANI